MNRWSKLIRLACSALSMSVCVACSSISRVPVVEPVTIVRVPPPRPEPLPRPDLQFQVLVPSTKDQVLTGNYTYLVLSWQDFLALAQWFESLKTYVNENNAVLNYWESNEGGKEQ